VNGIRIDKWLWAVRLYKTRTQAAEACRAGHVRLDGNPAKPSREVHVGDTLVARTGDRTLTVRVRALLENRVAAAKVPECLDDLTPPEERLRPREREHLTPAWRAPGTGRPTKRQRRQLDAWAGGIPTEDQ
jgi:ribosome-associated heat shock protein Hsp15